ncbi:MAG TPA: hypothetical protein VGJ63_19850 [Micromonosporaceae bacterium]
MQFTQCPDPACDAVAEIIDRFVLPSTGGYLEHVKVLCLHRHWFMLPVSSLKPSPARAPAHRVGERR